VARRTNRLSDDDLARVLELARKSDSVELKLTVPAADHRAAIAALGLDPLEAQIRQVFFFDTSDLALNGAGVVVRARRIQGRTGDTVVKLRPVEPDDLPEELRRSPSVTVEVDAMPGGYVCSASLKGRADGAAIRAVALGNEPARKLFTKEQRRFLGAHTPDGLKPKELGRRVVAELWLYADNSRILELSTKCTAVDAFQVAAEARLYLERKGVDLDGRQETKTKAALTFFSKQLRSAPAT
jgi:hypothetical protein